MKQSIVHIALVVKDYDEAIGFYTKKLNFDLIEDTYQPELTDKNVPEKIVDLRNRIANGIIISTSEYVFSIPKLA